MRARSTSPARSSAAARSASNRSSSRSSSLGRSSAGSPKRAPVLGRQIDAPELEVARHVLQEVDELQARAHGVARRDELGIVEPRAARRARAGRTGRPSARSSRFRSSHVSYSVTRWSIRFASIRRRNGSRGRSNSRIVGCTFRSTGHVGSPSNVSVDLLLELVERREPVALVRVAELVDEAARSSRARGRAGAARAGKRIEPTGKFSPAALAATSASSMNSSIRASFARNGAAMLEWQPTRRRGRAANAAGKERVVADGNGPAQDGTAGIREDPVAGIARDGRLDRRQPRRRARPLQRAGRCARRCSSAAPRRPNGSIVDLERGEVHRLDGARRADRGAHAHAEPPRLPARRARARDAPRPRDLRARPSLHRPRHAREALEAAR